MKRVVLAVAAVSVFALSGGAFAQDQLSHDGLYVVDAGGEKMVMGGADAAGTELHVGAGAKPDPCPPGHFYLSAPSEQMVKRCDDDMNFALAAPESGEKRPTGEAYPEGAMTLKPAK